MIGTGRACGKQGAKRSNKARKGPEQASCDEAGKIKKTSGAGSACGKMFPEGARTGRTWDQGAAERPKAAPPRKERRETWSLRRQCVGGDPAQGNPAGHVREGLCHRAR